MKEQPVTALIISPEFEMLIGRISKLREAIIELILEKNELLYKKKPELQNIYIRCIGRLEDELYNLRMESIRVKYITDLIRINISFSEDVDIKEIEARADAACKPNVTEREISEDNIDEAGAGKTEANEIDIEELKTLYRKIMKLLHPDIGRVDSSSGERLLKSAIEAYEYMDIQALKNIYDALYEPGGDMLLSAYGNNIFTELENRIETLEKKKTVLENSISLMRSAFPFDKEQFLSDPNKVRHEQKKLETGINSERKKLEKLKDRLRFYKIRSAKQLTP